MQWIRAYVLNIITAALLFAILSALVHDAARKKPLRLLSSLFLTASVLSPLTKLELRDFTLWEQSFRLEAGIASTVGEKLYAQSISEVISHQTEAYIIEKASQWTDDLAVTVIAQEEMPYAPETVYLEGSVGDDKRRKIQSMIENNLGIPKERQIWNGTSG